MHTARVVLYARFDPGAEITLVKVASERTLRAEGGEPIDVRRADEHGSVTFDASVVPGARYIACGTRDRHPFDVRARGQQGAADAPSPRRGQTDRTECAQRSTRPPPRPQRAGRITSTASRSAATRREARRRRWSSSGARFGTRWGHAHL
jgi:hypothetical protein